MKTSKSVVAFQGAAGAFSHAAAQEFLGKGVQVRVCETFQQIFQALEEGTATHGVIPIENTLHGSIHENYDHLLAYDFKIYGETTIRIVHHLIANPGIKFRDIRRVFSHPVALNQCRNFFEKHPNLSSVSHYDTAGSVKMVLSEKLGDAAAIASETAAAIYGGVILKRHLEDNRQNFTRFFLLSRISQKLSQSRSKNGTWKTSLVFSVQNSPGMLFRAMACFALRDLNLTKIESRPLRERPWEYLFYVDILGRSDQGSVEKALLQLQEIASFVRVLGSYRPSSGKS